MTAIDVLDRLNSLGCHIRIEGSKLKVRGPDCPELHELASKLRVHRDGVIALLCGGAETRGKRDCVDPEFPWLKQADLRFLCDLGIRWGTE
jgi:hypothetical protein